MSTQCLFLQVKSFIDPTFCGIFVCGPLQFKCPFLSAEPLASAVGPRSSQVSFLTGGGGALRDSSPSCCKVACEQDLCLGKKLARKGLFTGY